MTSEHTAIVLMLAVFLPYLAVLLYLACRWGRGK